MINEKDYEVARENLDARQSFLNGIDMEKYAPFVRNIKNHNKDSIGGKFSMATNSCFNLGRQATIHVSNFAFERLSPVDFYSAIVHHEGVHAEQLYHNPITFVEMGKHIVGTVLKKPKLLTKILAMEVEAYDGQTQDPSFQECSPEYQTGTQDISESIYLYHKMMTS